MQGPAGAKPPDPMCPMCGSPLAKSQAGLHVLGKVSQMMSKKHNNAPAPRMPGPGMSAPMGPTGPRRF